MNRYFIVFGLALCFMSAPQNSFAQDGSYSFGVDNRSPAPLPVESGAEELSEAEEDAAYAGDKSDITTEDRRFPKPEVDLIPETPRALDIEQPKAEADPCAVYSSQRARIICQDRMIKIERMNASKQKRSQNYTRGMQTASERQASAKAKAEAAAEAEKLKADAEARLKAAEILAGVEGEAEAAADVELETEADIDMQPEVTDTQKEPEPAPVSKTSSPYYYD